MKLKITFLALFSLVLSGCGSIFDTDIDDNSELFTLSASSPTSRIVNFDTVELTWTEVTIENFEEFLIERRPAGTTGWSFVGTIGNQAVNSYTDTVRDDCDFEYRVGLSEMEAGIRWASVLAKIPPTTYLTVPDEYDSLQAAISSPLIDDGDTVLVMPGRYYGTVTISGLDILVKGVSGYEETELQTHLDDYDRILTVSSGVVEGFKVIRANQGYGNPGGGVYLGGTGSLRNCMIAENTSSGLGGGVFLTENGNLYNNIIYGNSGNGGSGIHISKAGGEVINNTIVDNGVVITEDSGSLLFINNIIENSVGLDLVFYGQTFPAAAVIDYSLFDPIAGAGSSNISGDPEFNDRGNDDFSLKGTSPCLNSGHPGTDYLNRDGSRNTMGAYGGPLSLMADPL